MSERRFKVLNMIAEAKRLLARVPENERWMLINKKYEDTIERLQPVVEVAEAVERLEAENQALKWRLEALEKAANATQQCPSCGGVGQVWINDLDKREHIRDACPQCQGSGRVKA